MTDLDPKGPSQPTQQTGLNQAHNPAQKTVDEATTSQDTSSLDSKTVENRQQHDVPSRHGEAATASSLGQGDTGPLKEKDIGESDKQSYSKDGNLEGEQMRAPGEGEVADAVRSGGGGGHAEQTGLTENLNAKVEQHKEELQSRGERTGAEIDEEKGEDWTGKKADVGEALSGRGTKVVLAPEDQTIFFSYILTPHVCRHGQLYDIASYKSPPSTLLVQHLVLISMCYHSTYLFSLCGHASVSKQPVKNTNPCGTAIVAATDQCGDDNTGAESSMLLKSRLMSEYNPNSTRPLASPFPSPVEFEVVSSMQSSTPTLPAPPVATTHPMELQYFPRPNSPISTYCPRVFRHPLHTFILPLLCTTCQQGRDEKVARFEARTIREVVERDIPAFPRSKHWSGGLSTVVDPERKRIFRGSAVKPKGGLIPLICVEEHKWRTEKAQEPDQATAIRCEGEPLLDGLEVENVESTPPPANRFASTLERVVEDTYPPGSHSSSTSVSSTSAGTEASFTTTSGSGWSWWGRGAALSGRPTSSAGSTLPAMLTGNRPQTAPQQEQASTEFASADHGVNGAIDAQKQPLIPLSMKQFSRLPSPNLDWSIIQRGWKGVGNEKLNVS